MEFVNRKAPIVLKPYRARPFKPIEWMTEQELWDGRGGTLVFDSEFYSNYALIAFKCVHTNKVLMFETKPGVYMNVKKLSWILHNYTVVGFNSYDFDIPMVWLAYYFQDNAIMMDGVQQLIFENMRRGDFTRYYGFRIPDTSHIDLIEVCPLRGSLKTYGARLHTPRLQDLPFKPGIELTDDQIPIVANYCVNDLDITQLIRQELKEELDLRSIMSVEYNTDLMSKSNAQLSEAILSAELQKLTGKRPKKVEHIEASTHNYKVPNNIFFQTEPLKQALSVIAGANYEVLENGRLVVPPAVEALNMRIGKASYTIGNGGLHSKEKVISHSADNETFLDDVDVASYYPRIILNAGMFPKQLGPNFLKVYQAIYDRRIKAKEDKNISVSETLKIALNGAFGKLGSPYSILYSPELLIQVTVTGQLALLMLIEKLEMHGFTVASANTDGIVVKGPISRRAEMDEIVKLWATILSYQTEKTEYKFFSSRDVNNYIAIKKPDAKGKYEIKGKGAYLDAWSNPKLKIFRFHKNPMTTICIQAATQFIINGTPVEDTIKANNDIRNFIAVRNVSGGAHKDGEYLGKVVRWYYAKGVYGTINAINNGHTVSMSEGAKPCMDLPDSLPNDIDYNWYVAYSNRILENLDRRKKTREVAFL